MKKRILTILIALALVSVLLGGLPAGPARAALSSLAIDFWPSAVATNPDTADCNTTTATPFAVRVTVSGDPGDLFTVGIGLGASTCTYSPESGVWTDPTVGSNTNFPRGIIGAGGSTSLWVYGRLRIGGAPGTLMTLQAFSCTAGYGTCTAGPLDTRTINRLDLNSTSLEGGWLEETVGTDRDGLIVAVIDVSDDQSVALYPAEVNGIVDGFPDIDSYYKVAVPDCTGCDYVIEIWDPLVPGVPLADRQVNTMGVGGCPSDAVAGATTSLNGCGVPTAITLKSFSGTSASGIFILLAAVALSIVGLGLAMFLRRRKATW